MDVAEEGVLGIGLTALVAQRWVGVREVDEQPLDARTVCGEKPRKRAVRRHRLEHTRLDLEVPTVVDVAGLEDRSGGRCGVAATLECDGLEERLVRVAEVLVQVIKDGVAGLEGVHFVRPGTDRLEIRGAVLRLRAEAVRVLRLLQDRAVEADAPLEVEGLRRRVGHHDGVRVLRGDTLHAVANVEGRRR